MQPMVYGFDVLLKPAIFINFSYIFITRIQKLLFVLAHFCGKNGYGFLFHQLIEESDVFFVK